MFTLVYVLFAAPFGPAAADAVYDEAHRPQFHFTARKNWLNDPNGLVYYKGVWHMFFQHNPTGIEWGNMHWGHATSPDLVRWTDHGVAIAPDEMGRIWSGSAVVDWPNSSGLQSGEEKALVAFYTSEGDPFTQCIAYSNDGGKTWRKYEGNPVLGHVAGDNRDPKVIWHEPSRKWVMVLYLVDQAYAFFTSSDMKEWELASRLKSSGSMECPDLFPLRVEGEPDTEKWVFVLGEGDYLVGSFDGETFTPEDDKQKADWGNNFYATQTWSDAPDGRRIQIAWMRGGEYPGMPFNQQMSFPCELTLRRFDEGLRLCRNPVREIDLLRANTHSWDGLAVRPGENPLDGVEGDLFHIQAEIAFDPVAAPDELGFVLRGEPVSYDVSKNELGCLRATAPLGAPEGIITMQILLDRTSIEIFADGGRVSMSSCFLPDAANTAIGFYTKGAPVTLKRLDVHELNPAWNKAQPL